MKSVVLRAIGPVPRHFVPAYFSSMTQVIKICGLSTPETLGVARDAGATHLGFIFFPKSPRNVTPEMAGELAAERGAAKAVAVTVNADDAFLDAVVEAMRPDMLQLHGSETPERLVELKARYGLPLIKAKAVREPADVDGLDQWSGIADILLLDAKPPKGADLPGGNGLSFDWSLIETLQSPVPIWLSGGIGPENARQALDLVASGKNAVIGLDLSSGVESAPGVKDIAKIKQFLSLCRP